MCKLYGFTYEVELRIERPLIWLTSKIINQMESHIDENSLFPEESRAEAADT